MPTFRAHKVVAVLPGTLEPDTIYLVRAGAGFDLFASDSTGLLSFQVNSPLSWTVLANQWSASPTQVGTTPAGTVWAYTVNDETRFRLVPEPYAATQDAFYSNFSDGTLSGLIAARG